MTDFADDVAALYERHALAWDADRNHPVHPWTDKPWIARFGGLLPAGATVLDLGCGSGRPVASFLAERGLRLTGVDASPTLIGLCRTRLPEHEWQVGDMRMFEPGRVFAGILAWDSFFHLSPADQRAMFPRFARHAGPGTLLMFNSGPKQGEALGRYRGEVLHHASLAPAEYRALLRDNGFDIVANVLNDWNTGGGRTVWLARRQDQA